jgi:hypothetical protein
VNREERRNSERMARREETLLRHGKAIENDQDRRAGRMIRHLVFAAHFTRRRKP